MTALAPAIAVVGPAGSGKSTLLDLLDRTLQNHPSSPLVYIVKGSPDGTGRYLLGAPDLREGLKSRVKGAWGSTTVATICRWIESTRSRLELVLVDVGGRHSPRNRALYGECSHFLVVVRDRDERRAESERGDLDSWWQACEASGLEPVARVRSLWGKGQSSVVRASDGVLAVRIRLDAEGRKARETVSALDKLTEAILALRACRPVPGYLDLKLGRRWVFEDLADLGGRAGELERMIQEGRVVLGGTAPIWAYVAAMHRAIDAGRQVAVDVFDPKISCGIVRVPSRLAQDQAPLPGIRARWRPVGEGLLLDVALTAEDRFLGPEVSQEPHRLPVPEGPPGAGPIGVFGAAPIWVHLAYSRWLRQRVKERSIGLWDAGTRSMVFVTGPETPRIERWSTMDDLPGPEP